MYFFHQISNPLHMFHCILDFPGQTTEVLTKRERRWQLGHNLGWNMALGRKKIPPSEAEGFGGEDEEDLFGW